MTRRCAAAVGVLVAVVLAAACGVGVDDQPRALPLTETTTTTATSPSSGRFTSVLYLLREGKLMPLIRELPDPSLETTLVALLRPPRSDQGPSLLSTSIPSGTELLGVQRRNGRVVVDLSADFDNVVGLSRQQAIAQMVMTITEQAPDDPVEFQVEGETITVSSPSRGDVSAVGQCDFASLLASLDEAITAGLPAPALIELDARQGELDGSCQVPTTTAPPPPPGG